MRLSILINRKAPGIVYETVPDFYSLQDECLAKYQLILFWDYIDQMRKHYGKIRTSEVQLSNKPDA